MRRLLLALPLLLCLPATSYAQSGCTGQSASGTLCGNNTAGQAPPALRSATSIFDKAFGSNQGLVLNRGASTWNGTATPSLGLNGSTGGTLTLNGSSSGSSIIQVPAAAGTGTVFQLPATNGTNAFVLSTDGSGHTSWISAAAGGTVTSVGLALPANILTVSGSPVTTSGTLTGTLATQNANTVWSGPNTGAAATPTFRALVGADLPNPSTSSLGGIQAINAVASNWIRSINTSGVPQLSQPAFSDISGSITPAQCPNPSASTIGCVESLAAVTSKWVNTISTSGVPSATQPNFTDIAGNATLAQLPSISNNAVLGNNSGGTAIPASLTASNVLDMINNVQGDVLYRNAAGWVVLAPGTNGQVLTTAGAAANPTWTTVTGTGTVTSIATSGGLTGGTITTTGTLSLASIVTGNVLAYTGAGSGTPVATIPSTVLDVIGSTTGNILYRSSGSGWQVLAPGSNGQVLTMGASTPAWGSAGTVSNVTITAGTGLAITGTCNISTTGTCTPALSAARQTLPTTQTFTSGTAATYTTPANTLWIEVEMIGGGGGGGGSGTTPGNGAAGTATTFSTLTAGAGGGTSGGFGAGAGGAASGCALNQNGGAGGAGGGVNATQGGFGGVGAYGGGGIGGAAGAGPGTAGATNSGSGGGGAGVNTTINGGGGGGAGGFCKAIINSPAGTYTYTVGAGGNGGTTGTGGSTGGGGAAGRILVTEHYGS